MQPAPARTRSPWLIALILSSAVLVALVAPVVVAFARMYRGFHFPTDVIGGALLGVTWLAAMWAVILRPDHGGRPGKTAPADDAAGG